MKNKIPEFLKTQFEKKYPQYKKFPEEINQFILDYSNFYKWEITDIKLIYKMMKKGFSDRPDCALENCNAQAFISTDFVKFSKGCCPHHASKISLLEKHNVTNPSQISGVMEKHKETIKRKYGVENISQIKEVKDKKKKTTLKNYGVESPQQSKLIQDKTNLTNQKKYGGASPACSEKVRNKMKETTLIKYGVENISFLPEFRKKASDTMEIKYGVRNISFLPEFREKASDTMEIKYGVRHAMHSVAFIEKRDNACIERYGVKHPMQNPAVAEQSQKNSFNYKEYKWKTGEISRVQGYEGVILKELEDKGYFYNNIKTSRKDMPEIFYEFEGKRRRYYPDIFIPKENLIIEVKSDYTLNKEWEKNQAKFDATKNLGFNFKLEVR